MSRFFIERPIFAWVMAIVVSLFGALSIGGLPVSQYPEISPPTVQISASYPGASSKTVEDSVTQVIEQRLTGLDGLRYITSTSDASGRAVIQVVFDQGTNPDTAQMQVQNKLQAAMPLLPQVVQQQGLRVVKTVGSLMMLVAVSSTDPAMKSEDLSDYIVSYMQDDITRIPGVGEIQLFGTQYAMRIWLDPQRLVSYSLTPADVMAAIRAQNAEVSSGEIGGGPSIPGQQLNATVTSQSLLSTPEEFQQILVRTLPDGSAVRIGDVARVEIGSDTYAIRPWLNGKPAAGLGIYLASGANAVETSDAVRARVEALSKNFPPGLKATVPYDNTPFVKESIKEVVKTLIEAIVLVVAVIFLFLQNWRATTIAALTVPVVLLGVFAILGVLGFSINMLTMFAVVLAIGLLVDDTIVVVENVERVMREEHLSAKEATIRSMSQITGALIGIAVVLSAVFLPMAFLPGSTGQIYRQFSATIVSAMGLSALVALTLTPALCATILHHDDQPAHSASRLGRVFAWWTARVEWLVSRYSGIVGRTLAPKAGNRQLGLYAILLVVLAFLFVRLPTAFFPQEDQGFLNGIIQTPANATAEQMDAVLEKVSDHFLQNEKELITDVFTISGFGFAGIGQNQGLVFVQLKDWHERHGKDEKVQAIVDRAKAAFHKIREARIIAMVPPAVTALGISGGFDMRLVNTTGMPRDKFIETREQLLQAARKDPRLSQVRANMQDDAPQLKLDIDQHAATAFGVSVADLNQTLSAAWGGAYVNDFMDRGRVKRVYVQGDAPYRMAPEDIGQWYVRNGNNEMAPFSAFTQSHWELASPRLERFDGAPSFNLQGNGAPGVSSGEAMKRMEELASKFPGVGVSWTGISYEERRSGDLAPMLYVLSLLMVFLALAALYESWTIPLAVLVVVPLGLVGAVAAATLRGLSNDIYFQVGLLTTMGLAAKNAILIVEFARSQADQGKDFATAALEAARLRMRPILMTSIAFVFGVMPLALASGAGAGAQVAIGTAVVGGTLAATLLVPVLTPFFFVIVNRWFSRRSRADAPEPSQTALPSGEH